MPKLLNYQRAVISSALKRSNQRLAQISKNIPNTIDPETSQTVYSSIQRQQIAPFVNSEYAQYLKESKSGNPTFDIRKVLKDIESGALDPSEANDFLVKSAGIRFSPEGEIVQTSEGGIATTKEIVSKAKEALGADMPRDELMKRYADIVEIREDFNMDYNDYTEAFDKDTLKSNPITAKLFNPADTKQTRGQITYDEMKAIHDEIVKELGPKAQRAKNFGKPATYGGNK